MILILDNIRSAHNVGAIFRTADGAGLAHNASHSDAGVSIYLVGITPKPAEKELYLTVAEKTLKKTALGAEKTVAWKYVKTLPPLLRRLKEEGYTLVALEQSDKSVDYREYQPHSSKVALIVGNEVEGVAQKVLEKVDTIIELPMQGKKNSLNVAVATGIALYHLSGTMERE